MMATGTETKNEVKVGDEFHFMALAGAFNETGLDYHHLVVEKVFKKTCRVRFITTVGCGFSTQTPLDELQSGGDRHKKDVRIYFKTLEDAVKYWGPGAEAHYKEWEKQLEGYTPKHPDYEHIVFQVEMMRKYAELLADYSIEKHKKIIEEKVEGYKKHKAGRFAHVR